VFFISTYTLLLILIFSQLLVGLYLHNHSFTKHIHLLISTMSNSTSNPFAPSSSMHTISTTTPPTYIIATVIIISILLIFVLVGSWIYYLSTCKDTATPQPSHSRYTTQPTFNPSINTLPSWFRNITRSSPTLPLFKQNENDLALLREVLWSHPEDDYKPAKRRSAPSSHKQRPLTSHPVLFAKSTTISPTLPANAHIVPSNTKPSLLARRQIRASKQPLALALPAITEKSDGKKKGKGKKPTEPPPGKAHPKISSPKLPNNVAERLAQRYQLISPLRQKAHIHDTAISSSPNPLDIAPGTPTNAISTTNPICFQSKPLTEHPATASTSSIVLSPTIAHRRILTSGPTEGDIIADLKSPYIYTPDFVRTPARTPGGRAYTPYRRGFVGNDGMGGIDGIVAIGSSGGGKGLSGVGAGGGGRVMSPKLPHPGDRCVGSL